MNSPHAEIFDQKLQKNLLICLFTAAFLLRIWGVWNATSTDEYNEVFEALRVCSGNLNLERWFKRFYLYVLSVEYGIYYGIGRAAGMFQSPQDFAVQVVRDLSPLFIIARVTSALFGTGSVVFTYLAGKKLFNPTTGLIAALFLCLNVVNIELSHYARVDATLGCMVMGAFYFIVRIFKDQEDAGRFYMMAGLFAGIAFQVKPQAIVLLFPFAYAHFSRYGWQDFSKTILSKDILKYGLAFMLGLVIGNPAIIFAPVKFASSFLGMGKVYTTTINESKNDHVGFIAYGIYLFRELGVIFTCLAGFCLIKSLLNRKAAHLLLLSFMLPFYLLMGASQYMVSFSYMIPFMPFLYLLIASCLLASLHDLGARYKHSAMAVTFILLCLLAQPAFNVIKFELSMTGPNTRILAKRWVEANITPGSKILMDSGKTINSSAPEIAMNEESIKRILNAKKMAIETGTLQDTTNIVDEKSLVFFEMLMKTVPHEAYDITSTAFGLEVRSIDYYINNQFQYFIISQGMRKARIDPFFADRHPEVAFFYKSIDSDPRLKLIKTISPSRLNRGESFSIYKLSS